MAAEINEFRWLQINTGLLNGFSNGSLDSGLARLSATFGNVPFAGSGHMRYQHVAVIVENQHPVGNCFWHAQGLNPSALNAALKVCFVFQ